MPSHVHFQRRQFIRSIVAAGGAALGLAHPLARAAAPVSATRPKIAGRLVARGDANYESWRQSMPWQMRKPGRYPQFIAQVRDTEDVVRCIRFASHNGLQVAVKSGGHHVWSNFLREGGLLLDLAQLRSTTVDAGARIAHAGPSVWGRNFLQRTLPYGLGFPVAHCATVPLGGFLLGGGFGLNADEWGTMSCFGVAGAQVVTAAGDVLEVNASHHPEWFWALRGAGNGFPGVVTRFDLRLSDAPPTVLASTYIFPASRITEVSAWAAEVAHTAPRHTEILGIVAVAGANAAGRNQVICALRVANFSPSADEGQTLLASLASHPLAKSVLMKIEREASDWDALFLSSIDAGRGFGFGRYAVDNLWTDQGGAVMQVLAEQLAQSPAPYSHSVVQFKVRTQLPEDAAFSVMAPVYAGLYAVWHDPSGDQSALDWLRRSMLPLEPYARGHYINEIDAEARPGRIEKSFSSKAWNTLAAHRRKADAHGVFADFFGRSDGSAGDKA